VEVRKNNNAQVALFEMNASLKKKSTLAMYNTYFWPIYNIIIYYVVGTLGTMLNC